MQCNHQIYWIICEFIGLQLDKKQKKQNSIENVKVTNSIGKKSLKSSLKDYITVSLQKFQVIHRILITR